MELRDVVHMDGDADLGRRGWVGVSGQEAEEDGVGTVVELFWSVCVDVASEDVPEELSQCPFILFDRHLSQWLSATRTLLTKGRC